jgi:tetratricopeptide (TPR) repeat protein
VDNLGANLQQLRRFEEAITALQDAAAIYREVGDLHGEATALNNLAWALQQTGRSEKAIAALQDATAIYRKVGDRHGESVVLDNLRAVRPAPPGEQP